MSILTCGQTGGACDVALCHGPFGCCREEFTNPQRYRVHKHLKRVKKPRTVGSILESCMNPRSD